METIKAACICYCFGAGGYALRRARNMTLDRRGFLAACSRAGMTSALLPGVLYTLATQAQEAVPGSKAREPAKITAEMLDQAAALAGVGPFSAEQKQMMLDGLNDQRGSYDAIRA